MFHQSFKIESIKPLHLVSVLRSPVWLTALELCYHLLKKIAFVPLKKVVLFMNKNFRADVKLGT